MKLLKNKQAPTYLHFLDRELRRAENVNYSDYEILEALIIAVTNSLSYCYSSASLLLENNEIFPQSTKLLLELEKFEFIKLITNERSFEEFIESRRKIYAHEVNRYPMYFTKDTSELWPANPIFVDSSTTSILRNNISIWMENPSKEINLLKESFTKESLDDFGKKLQSEKEKAITLDLVKNQLANNSAKRNFGRLISYFYTKRYMELQRGDILCNLRGISYYDVLSANPLTNNSVLLRSILKCCSIPNYFFLQGSLNITFLLELLHIPLFKDFQIEYFSLVNGIVSLINESRYYDLYSSTRYLATNFRLNPKSGLSAQSFLSQCYGGIYSFSAEFSRVENVFFENYTLTKNKLTMNKKVLLVTATPVEAKVVMEDLGEKGLSPTPISIGKVTTWNLGILRNCELNLLKLSEMGSSKPSGSALTIYDAVMAIKPDYVIMVGIAFGLKKDRQKIGDIVVSRELEDYDSNKKTETGMIQRGHRIPAGATLLDRFDNTALSFKKSNVEVGFVISGDTLSDNESFVNDLKKSFPEAIGAEMEGTGLQSSCHRSGIEWILIKGICDWGYNKSNRNKEKNQKLAISNVCDYLIYSFETLDF